MNGNCKKEFRFSSTQGILDGRTEPGGANPYDWRVLLNFGLNDQGRMRRMWGWRRLGTGNEDLRDQLLGGQGEWAGVTTDVTVVGGGASTLIDVDDGSWIEDGDTLTHGGNELTVQSHSDLTVTVQNSGSNIDLTTEDNLIRVTDGRREAISALFQASASTGGRYLVACTKSRIYVNTGASLSWRMLADGLGDEHQDGDSAFRPKRWELCQVGDFVLFSNGHNQVLAWPIGGEPILGEDTSYRRWSAYEVYDLAGLRIEAATCLCSWNGFAFLGDSYVDGTREASRIYWSDFNRPLEWAPGGESIAGYYDFGKGQKILKIAVLSGTLRIYTDTSIYVATFVGGDAVFQFQEIYSGPSAIKYKWSFVSTGDRHVWLSRDGMVIMGRYDGEPRSPTWMYRASGIILNGISSDTLAEFPADFASFGSLNEDLCHQITSGHDPRTNQVWITWPTVDEDEDGFEGNRHITMVFSLRFEKSWIVDHPFSAYTEWVPDRSPSIRDFTIQYCICDAPGTVLPKEGIPLNTVSPQCSGVSGGEYSGPDWIVNQYEYGGGEYGIDQDSLCSMVGDIRIDDLCTDCITEPLFIGASLIDLTIKQFDRTYHRRDIYDYESDTQEDFPQTSAGEYTYSGYPSVAQTEIHSFNSGVERMIDAVMVDFTADVQEDPGQLRVDVGTSNVPTCSVWDDSDPVTLDCLWGDDEVNDQHRASDIPSFRFHSAGKYTGIRFWIEGSPDEDGEDGPTEPVDCSVSISGIVFRHWPRTRTWI